MSVKTHYSFIVLIFLISSCNNHSNTDRAPAQGEIHEIADATLILQDSIRLNTTYTPHQRDKPANFEAFKALRKVLNEEHKRDYNHKNDSFPLVISNPDSIQEYTYITNLFPASEIEQLIFEGTSSQAENSKFNLSIGACLRIKFKDQNKASEALNRLYKYQPADRSAITHLFKPGGMAFVLENELCLYCINLCSGDQDITAIDSLIFRNVYHHGHFERLHTDCGMQPFKKLID